jgi:hypothetical protein
VFSGAPAGSHRSKADNAPHEQELADVFAVNVWTIWRRKLVEDGTEREASQRSGLCNTLRRIIRSNQAAGHGKRDSPDIDGQPSQKHDIADCVGTRLIYSPASPPP